MLNVDATDIYNVGTGRPVSFETVAQSIINKHGGAIEYIPMPENLKLQYQSYTCANIDKLNSVIDMNWTNIEDYINGK
jgi:ADP-L-glycero-D-manno-heptose 6-epimerase